ncbi:Band 7 domain-containing protein [Klenkia terrae]|uniref:SPFH domain-containing protein n=1 Tax=Klenkia terrae TaxID=1052259 RepID=UPI00176D167D|nr:SPFH domain-containing protein [Klenkia terrae]SSC23607.1 Band 7 domain-containing protein [Klenkia terrae]
MADIARYPFVRHLRGSATAHVQHVTAGRLRHGGTGASFWFRPLSAVLSEIPVDDRELPLLFHARTADFQDVTVQMTLTFRFADPVLAAGRVDFSVDPDTGTWRGTPLEQVAGLLTESAQQHAIDLLAGGVLTTVLTAGVGPVRAAVAAGLAADARLVETGIAVVDVRVVAIRPEPEMERALRTPTREQVQAAADAATYARRATAVERERAISENELANQVELARREEELVGQRGVNARREAENAAEAAEVAAGAKARRDRTAMEVEADRKRVLGEATGAANRAELAAWAELPIETVHALALRQLANNLPQIQNLTITPELLTGLLAKLGAQR